MIDNEVYYRLYKNKEGLITVVCLQDFDECDYDSSRFVRNSSNYIYKFNTKEEAIEKLKEWYQPSQIDRKYRIDHDLIRD